MKYTEDKLTVDVEHNKFMVNGFIETWNYSGLNQFICEAIKQIPDLDVEFDFCGCKYLNSEGIRTFAVCMLESGKRVKVRIDKGATWQRVGLTPLAALKHGGNIRVVNA